MPTAESLLEAARERRREEEEKRLRETQRAQTPRDPDSAHAPCPDPESTSPDFVDDPPL